MLIEAEALRQGRAWDRSSRRAWVGLFRFTKESEKRGFVDRIRLEGEPGRAAAAHCAQVGTPWSVGGACLWGVEGKGKAWAHSWEGECRLGPSSLGF